MSPRVDVLGPTHKEIRLALGALLARMGSATFSDNETSVRIAHQLGLVLDFCDEHRAREDRLVVPALAARLNGTLTDVIDAHALEPRHIAELRALGETLVSTPPERRAVAGRTLYLHFSRFFGELLLHMADEEQMMQPLLQRLLGDDELREIHSQLTR